MKNLPLFLRLSLLLLMLCFCPATLCARAVPIYKTEKTMQTRPAPQQKQARRGAVLLLAFFIPPLAVWLWQDKVITRWFWWAFVLMFLGFLPAVLYAFYVVLR